MYPSAPHSLPTRTRRRIGNGAGTARSAAFTLLEVLVAMGILSMLVVFLFGALRQGSDLIQRTTSRVDAFGSARAALDFMSRELAQTVRITTNDLPRVGGAKLPQDGLVTLYLDYVSPFAGQTNSFLYAVAALNDAPPVGTEETRRDLVEIGYGILFVEDTNAPPDAVEFGSWQLVRTYAAGDYVDVYDYIDTPYPAGGQDPHDWYKTPAPPANPPPSAPKWLEVVRHVAFFTVQADPDSGPWRWDRKGDLPKSLRIRLGVVSEGDARDAWRASDVTRAGDRAKRAEAWLEYVQTNGMVRVFETSVALPEARP